MDKILRNQLLCMQPEPVLLRIGKATLAFPNPVFNALK